MLRGLIAIDTRSLALFRIALAALILIDVAQRLLLFGDFYSGHGIYPVELGRRHAQGAWSLYFLSDADAWQAGLMAVTAALAALLAAGWRTRAVTPALFVLLLSLHARAPLALDVGDHAMRYLLFWMVLLPSGSREPRSVASPASAGLLVQVAGIYVWAGLSKLRSPHWLAGTALTQALAGDTWTGPLADFLYARPAWLPVLNHLTLAVEALVPYGLFAPSPVRYFSVAVLLVFNLCLGASLQLGLIPWVLSAGLLLFIQWGPSEPAPGGRWQTAVALMAWPVMAGTSIYHVLTPEPLAPALARPLHVLQAEQAWLMYFTPYPENFRLQLVSGDRVVGIGAHRPEWPPLESTAATERFWRSYRARMYLYDGISDPSRRAEWDCFRTWYSSGEVVVRKEVRRVRAPGGRPGPGELERLETLAP